MQKHILTAAALASLLSLAACQSTPPAADKPALNDAAKAALATAESDVKKASAQGALWTTADSALKAAKAAAAKGDNDAVIKNAKTASTHAKMGLDTLKYPAISAP